MLSCNRVLKQREDIPRYGKITNNSFLGTVCSNIFCENCLFQNVLMHLSTKVVRKQFFFNTSFKQFTSPRNLGKSETIANIRKSNVNTKPGLYSSATKY